MKASSENVLKGDFHQRKKPPEGGSFFTLTYCFTSEFLYGAQSGT
ncbi:hypothetical protein [Xenorhabdus hominickii]|nr:hypothetical protein [Xenorhabdus hominickii]